MLGKKRRNQKCKNQITFWSCWREAWMGIHLRLWSPEYEIENRINTGNHRIEILGIQWKCLWLWVTPPVLAVRAGCNWREINLGTLISPRFTGKSRIGLKEGGRNLGQACRWKLFRNFFWIIAHLLISQSQKGHSVSNFGEAGWQSPEKTAK